MNWIKRTLAAAASMVGISAAAADNVKMVNPKDLLYSLPTIEDALPALSKSTPLGSSPHVIHEDDWRQFEFVSTANRAALDAEIRSIDEIHSKYSVPMKDGWSAFKQLHVRRRIPAPIVSHIGLNTLKSSLGPDAVILSSLTFRGAPTAIANSFAVKLDGVVLYGLIADDGISALCVDLGSRKPSLSKEQADALVAWSKKNNLLLVHWPSRSVLESEAQISEFLSQK